MRIVAGEHRGRVLKVPDGLDTRPTTDRVREAIMSSLYSMLGGFSDAVVLDAFSGSGAMGLEAMSRGAKFALLNDFSQKSRFCIDENVKALHYTANEVQITGLDILKSGLPSTNLAQGHAFNLVFLDPPYATSQNEIAAILALASASGLFKPNCIIAYEHGEKASAEFIARLADANFIIKNEKHYGKTYVTYIEFC